jgi:hypothetical protein
MRVVPGAIAALAWAFAQGCLVQVKDYPLAGTGMVGDRCASDGDCVPSLTCVTPASEPYGVAGGLCTTSCDAGHPCPLPSTCFVSPINSFCLPPCIYTSQNPDKCGGRLDMACAPLDVTGTNGVCRPSCANDAACDGRFCDPYLGVCVSDKPTGEPPGTVCSSDSICRGDCLSTCTEICTIGAPDSCPVGSGGNWIGLTLRCSGQRGDETTGDVGYCAPSCVCQPQCPASTDACNIDDGNNHYCGPTAAYGPGTVSNACPAG